jgi:nucleotide-binding universal stress UspA family protein
MSKQNQYIYACIGSSRFSESVCNYSIDLSKSLNLPLKFFTSPKNSLLLEEFTENAKCKNVKKIFSLQKDGNLYENLLELQDSIRVVIVGLDGIDDKSKKSVLCAQVEKIIKDVKAPIFLVNGEYRPIRKVLIAYDGSLSSQKALEILVSNPIFQNVQRDIVSVNNEAVLQEAKKKLLNSNINANFIYLEGEPVTAILSYQEECNIDLIAMGAFGHGTLHHIIYGSATHHMLLEACVPLLLIR